MSDIIGNYGQLLGEVKQRIRAAQYEALKKVNQELIHLYWDIGRLIYERQQGESWGKSVVEQLSDDLLKEFPGIKGFSARNIWRMRDFYLHYRDNPKLTTLLAEISWSHNLTILSKCKDDQEREFYIRMSRKYGWSLSVLNHQVENQTYEKTLLNQTNFEGIVPEQYRNQAKLAVKDGYTFDFLELSDEHSERQLESAILSRVQNFLQEMGGLFTFAGSQFRIEVGSKEYFIDLLLYHRGLRCLVAVDLKVGEFEPEYIGKMQFYLTVLDDQVKMPFELPSIGIILCKSKDKTIVEYALKDATKPIGVATYHITSELPKELRGQLPDPAEVARLIEELA